MSQHTIILRNGQRQKIEITQHDAGWKWRTVSEAGVYGADSPPLSSFEYAKQLAKAQLGGGEWEN